MKYVKTFEYFLNEGRVPTSDRIKLLENDDYLVVAPITNRAAQKYGAFTKWCTAVPPNESVSSITKSTIAVDIARLVIHFYGGGSVALTN